MSAARIIRPPPLSGGDRKFFAREIHKAEVAYEHELRAAKEAHAAAEAALARAYALDCIAWNTGLFIGELEQPSPTIAAAIAGRFSLLEVHCDQCKRTEIVDLALVVQPRSRLVAQMRDYLFCGPCRRQTGRKSRPDLVGLRPVDDPQPAPDEAPRKRRG